MSLQDLFDDNIQEQPKSLANNFLLILYDPSNSTFYRTGQMYFNIFQSYYTNETIKLKKSTKSNIIKSIERNITCEQFMFIYVGHGLNSGGSTPLISTDKGNLNVSKILRNLYDNLRLKNVVEIYDCCNSYPFGEARRQQFNFYSLNLLMNLKGFNSICSSKPGKYSYFIDGKHTFFFQAFESVLSGSYNDINDFLSKISR